MIKASSEQIHAANTNNNALMSLSEITFSGIERLTMLNLNATRSALQGGLDASVKLGKNKDVDTDEAVQETTNYLQEVQKIVTDTQQAVSKLMGSYFSAQGKTLNLGAEWRKGSEMMKDFGAQVTEMAEDNQKLVAHEVKKAVSTATQKG